jgi:L-lactate dehydrogenase complex protein LldG
VTGTRDEILGRVRAALADVPPDETPDDVVVPRDYRRTSDLTETEVLAQFVEAVEDYGATVHRAQPDQLSTRIHDICTARGIRSLVTPPGFPEQWLSAAGISVRRDSPPISDAGLDDAGAVITTAAVGIAETGTIALVSGAGMGRRALSLVPDVHLCVIRSDEVVATVPEAMDRLAEHTAQPITFISGGSATSDVELVRVEGVHGPRTLEVLLVQVDASP